MKFINIYIIMLFVLLNPTYSQKEYNNWYFGNYAGITFNTPDGSPIADTNSAMRTLEGCATISDSIGNLLFYSNGVNVWNRIHKQMPNGFGLLGDTDATQSALIIPYPNNKNLYYIFTTKGHDVVDSIMFHFDTAVGLNYSIVDMSLEDGLGDVITKNILLYKPTTEKLVSVRHKNDKDIWVITHQVGNNAFTTYLITEQGLNLNPVISNIGISHKGGKNVTQGYLKACPERKKISAVIGEKRIVQLFNFDNSTGIISDPITICLSYYHRPYGVEFSPDGTLLYVSCQTNHSIPEIINQYSISIHDSNSIAKSEIVISKKLNLEALQLGPNGKIYVAQYNEHYLGVINKPNLKGIACNFISKGVNLTEDRTCLCGLPNSIINIYPMRIKVNSNTPLCEGDTLYLKSKVTNNISKPTYIWIGPNGFSSNEPNPIILNSRPEMSGLYMLTASVNGFKDTDSIYITINPRPESIIAANGPTTFCEGDSIVLSASPSGAEYNYLWSTSSTFSEITIKEQGTYTVIVENSYGCKDSASIIINVNPSPEAKIIANGQTSFCEGDSVVLSALPSGAEYDYLWSTSSTSSEITVKESGTYTLIVENSYGCKGRDTIIVTVNPHPEVNIIGNEIICEGSSAVLQTENEYMSYEWSSGETTRDITISEAGTYSVVVIDSNGCEGTSESIEIKEAPNPEPEIIGNKYICKGESLNLDLLDFDDYNDILWNTDEKISSITITEPGEYWVEVTDKNGCTGADTLTVELIVINIGGLENVAFDSVYIGNEDSKEITLTNNGIDTVIVESVSIKGIEGNIFSPTPNPQPPIPIPPGESIEVEIKFKPDAERKYLDSLLVAISEPCSETRGIELTGEGIGIYVTSEVWLPDIVGKIGNKNFRIPLTARMMQDTTFTNLSYTTEIRFNARFYKPESITEGNLLSNSVIDGDRVLKIEGVRINLSSDITVLTEIQGLVLLGDKKETPLIINEFSWYPPIPDSSIIGRLTITGVCQPLLSRIQSFTPTSMQIIPNPANEYAEIVYYLNKPANVYLSLQSLFGESVIQLEENKYKNAGRHSIELNTSTLPSGLYYVLLNTANKYITRKISIVK